MKRLLFTTNIEYDMRDWVKEPIEKVFAGTNCIMAITTDGRTLQKTTTPKFAVMAQYWTRIRHIALSGWASCAAIGLVSDGTCLISKRALRYLCDCFAPGHSSASVFEHVNNTIKSWSQIQQVAISDAYFALEESGKVRMIAANQGTQNAYAETAYWSNIRRIVTGSTSDAVFGLTEDGRVMCAGENVTNGPHGDIRKTVSQMHNVIDVGTMGSECEAILFAFKDGTVMDLSGTRIPVTAWTGPAGGGQGVLESHFLYETIILNSERHLVRYSHSDRNLTEVFPNHPEISSFAVGDCQYGPPFVLAVEELG